MAYNVKFLKGTATEFAAATVDNNTFYYVDGKDLYLGNIKLSNGADLSAALIDIAAHGAAIGDITTLTTTQKASLVAAVNELKSEIAALTGGESGGIADMIENVTGDVSNLTTTEKTNLVAAINELKGAIDDNKVVAEVKIETNSTTAGMLKSYTVKQGTKTVGTIDIPKDMVVSSAVVEKDPAGQPAGTYIVLTIANATNDKVYVNVGTLVDIYTAEANATQVQLTVNQSTNEISAAIVAGSITATELAANAVETGKIKDLAVTKAKLAKEVTDELAKATSAVQSVAEGTANGTIAVDGTDVNVHGLKSAAYAETTAFDAAGAATTAETNAKAYIDTALTWQTIA